jgi:hypothetical protein
VEGVELPLTKGMSFLRADPATGRLLLIREHPEHFIKMGHLAVGGLSLAAPLIRAAGPAALPSFWMR